MPKGSIFTGKSHYSGGLDSRARKADIGKQTQTNGYQYEGQWKAGFRHGYGVLSRLQPNMGGVPVKIYVGDWQHGQKHGLGLKYYNIGVYYAHWKRDKRDGRGCMWFDNGDFYVGNWQHDAYHGVGILTDANGTRYHGEWHRGQKHGDGVFFHPQSGQVQRGLWKRGVCVCGWFQDWNRNAALQPTPYPIPELKLCNFGELYDQWTRELRDELELESAR